MGQQEDFRTPDDGRDAAQGAPSAPIFDERSAQRAAPVVPLERVARRRRLATWTAGGWREVVRSPQFHRSWPLALLLVATLVAGVAATNFYDHEDTAQRVAPATAATADDTAANADAQKPAASNARGESDTTRDARRASEAAVVPGEKSVVNPETFTASALGGFLGNADDEQPDAASSGRDERSGGRDKGKGQKRSKRRHGQRRTSGGAILFDVIR